MEDKSLQDYYIGITKRKVSVSAIVGTIFLISLVVATLLPSIFKSSTTILIEQQEIPSELVMSTITSYASERIQVIKARVMTRTNLFKIIDKFKLYQDEIKVETKSEIIARMREDVSLDFISADVVDPRTGRPSTATIAFSLSYQSDSRLKAQRVANELTTLYLDENVRSRSQEAEATADFLQDEAKRLGDKIDMLENKLAIFKQKNAKSLPGAQGLNIIAVQRKENEFGLLDLRINTLSEKVSSLRSYLAQTDPGVAESYERLKKLQAQYSFYTSKYSSKHPDVLRLKSEIESLGGDLGAAKNVESIVTNLDALKQDLSILKKKYKDEHPDVITIKKQIKLLNAELVEFSDDEVSQLIHDNPTNPVYIAIQTELDGAVSDLRIAKDQRDKLIIKIDDLQEQLFLGPEVERAYLTLKRDYSNAVTRYNETKAKQTQADIAKQLESQSKGERFTLIEPATFPEKPISPNRPVIMFLGFILALFCGLGFAIVSDLISGTVRGSRNLNNLVGAMPLTVIPFEFTVHEKVRTKTIKIRFAILFILIVLSAVVLIHFLVSPLDVLWFRVLRKLDVLMA